MTESTGTIYFSNIRQAALFENEIKGQISDGAWENTKPDNHWVFWCNIQTLIDEKNPRTVKGEIDYRSRCRKNGYQLTSLLEDVGDRMMSISVLSEILGTTVPDCLESLFEDCFDYNNGKMWRNNKDPFSVVKNVINKWSNEDNSYAKGVVENAQHILDWMNANSKEFNDIMLHATDKQMKSDLKEIRKMMKQFAC